MTKTTENDWESGEKSGLISIGTHNLFVSVSGPARNVGEPIVLIVSGMGGTSCAWPAVIRHINSFSRIMVYDRSGLGYSEKPCEPSPRTGLAIAQELSTLLEAAHISAPYVLLAHSFGGILAREFLALHVKDVVGLCLVDTNSERTYIDRAVPDFFFKVMMEGIDYYAVTGLNESHNMTNQEWQTLMHAQKGDAYQEYSAMEWQDFQCSSDALAVHRQYERLVLGKYPVSVVKGNTIQDIRKIGDAAIKRGNGTKEQQEEALKIFETFDEKEEKLQRDQLRLSSNSRFVYATKSGHSVHYTEPELIATEIKWILDTYAQMEH